MCTESERTEREVRSSAVVDVRAESEGSGVEGGWGREVMRVDKRSGREERRSRSNDRGSERERGVV